MAEIVDDYDLVVAELSQRGHGDLADEGAYGRMPNRILAFPGTLELFYVQRSPRLAAWAKYQTQKEFEAAVSNLAAERLKRAPTIEIDCALANDSLPFSGPEMPDKYGRIADGNQRVRINRRWLVQPDDNQLHNGGR